jgi:hypothetical protein
MVLDPLRKVDSRGGRYGLRRRLSARVIFSIRGNARNRQQAAGYRTGR